MALTEDDCRKILRQYAESYSEFISFNVKPYGPDVVGYLGEHCRLQIVFTDKKDIYQQNFFVKRLPSSSGKHQDCVKNGGFLKKEILVYKNLISEFQKDSEIAFAPKMFLCKGDSCLVLEDLLAAGFSTYSGSFDLELCLSLMKTLAAFHASSIIFEERRKNGDNQYFIKERYPEETREVGFIFDTGKLRNKWMETTFRSIIDCIKIMPEVVDANDVITKLTIFFRKYAQQFLLPSKEFRNVLTHSDLWRNNFMVKRNDHNQLETILVDLQFTRYVPPVYDILFVLYVNTSSEFLDKNLDEILNFYYKNFCQNLEIHNLRPESILSEKAFYRSFESYKLIALLEVTMTGTITYLDEEVSKRLLTVEGVYEDFFHNNRSKYVCQQFHESAKFRELFSNVLRRLVSCVREASYLHY